MRKVELGKYYILPYHADKVNNLDMMKGKVIGIYKHFFMVEFKVGPKQYLVRECYPYYGPLY